MFGALKAVLASPSFHPVRCDEYSEYVYHDDLIQNNGTMHSAKPKDKDDCKKRPKLECPFVRIDDEVYQIKEDGLNASMNVTSYFGELLPPFLSAKGISWLNKNFKANKLDIFIDTYAKSGTTLTIKLVHQVCVYVMLRT